MRILAVGAHPDDIEILCSGTLLNYAQQGHEIVVAVATNGDQGHITIMPPELAEIRRKEAAAAVRILGAEFEWMGYHDQFLFHDEATRRNFIELVRRARPDMVITHAPNDYAMDHRTVSDLIFAATFMASAPHMETGGNAPPTKKVPPVYYMDNVGGANFQPTQYVDITATIDKKLEMLECHQSQLVWLKEHDNLDVVAMTRTVAEFRGFACGVKYAEAFRNLDAWARNPAAALLR